MVRIELVNVRLPGPLRAATELAPRLTFDRGVSNVIVGACGAGKSALLEVIAGLRAPATGNVLFDECDVTGQSPWRRNVTRMAAIPVVYPRLTVRDNLALPLRNRGGSTADIAARVAEVGDTLGLCALSAERAGGLSLAQQQRVALGRAFVRRDAAAILLDDPFSALPLDERGGLRDALGELAHTVRATVVLATRELDEALSVADRVVFLDRGRVLQEGTPGDLFARPRTTELARMLSDPALNVLPCEVRAGALLVGSARIVRPGLASNGLAGRRVEVGVRPDELRILTAARDTTLLATLETIERRGVGRLVTLRAAGQPVRVLCDHRQPLVHGARYHVELPSTARVYVDGELTDG